MPLHQKKSGGSKKYGRHKLHCAAYRAAQTREKNKRRKELKEALRMEKIKARIKRLLKTGALVLVPTRAGGQKAIPKERVWTMEEKAAMRQRAVRLMGV